ncbi:hypothetical protein JOF56_005671 [Kibdelosporangium banguiense]|uniref:DUF4436 domain-containing protein n=1 Tax=Kibdelosporangium banguiense TaxID=1365924 RepID=A0ABS4TN17_9PSEU|nr:hypothetical protein [Kibdelosporangium banguiense]MBP2325286.1 hypothetical protein [Kibdelosporangium banguiense]
MRRVVAAGVVFAFSAVLFGATPAAAAEPLSVEITLDGKEVTGNTVTIEPNRPAELTVTAVNQSDKLVAIRSVRVSGVALALTFFAYDTTVPFEVPPGQTVTRTLVMDFADLEGQAIGLLPTTIDIVNTDRDVVGTASTVVDVRGSLWSVYGVFGLAMLGLTALLWAGALFALARHKLSPNRWRRALRFLPGGIGAGLVAVVTLSVLRLVPPAPAVEIPLILVAAAIGLILGYLTPHPIPEPLPELGPDDPTIGMTTRRMDTTTEAH